MCTTKEKILLTSLKLFAQDGYEAVSISKISGELGMAKSALHKHYKNKKDIFDSIVKRMEEMDFERAGWTGIGNWRWGCTKKRFDTRNTKFCEPWRYDYWKHL